MLRNWFSRITIQAEARQNSQVSRAGQRSTMRRRRAELKSAAALESLEARMLLTAYVVDTTEDGSTSGDGMISLREAITAANSNAAFLDATAGEAGPGIVDTISFAPALDAMTITLNGNALTISDDLIIFDSNANGMRVHASNLSRVFEIADGANGVSISDITISGGQATTGGGILIDSGEALTLDGVNVESNTATSTIATEGGGGIFNDGGTLTVSNSEFNRNIANISGGAIANAGTLSTTSVDFDNNFANGDSVGDGGGAIFNNGGTLTIIDGNPLNTGPRQTVFASNEARGHAGSGGAILSVSGPVEISGASIDDNVANRAGGGIEVVSGTVTLTDIRLSGNRAHGLGGAFIVDGNGGGLHISGDATVAIIGGWVSRNVAIEGGGLWNSETGTLTITTGAFLLNNISQGDGANEGGGAIFNNGGNVVIDGTASFVTMSGNRASGSGGGILNLGGFLTVDTVDIRGNGAQRSGGGIGSIAGTVVITRSALSGNRAESGGDSNNGGGLHISGAGDVTIHNTTISGNSATNEGAGLWNSNAGTLKVRNASIINNSADSAVGGGVFTAAGGTTSLVNTIVAGNLSGVSEVADDLSGLLNAGSTNNLIGDANSSGGLSDGTTGNIVGINGSGTRQLDTIVGQLNGAIGQIASHPLIIDSPAIDAGTDLTSAGIITDQNGTARPIGLAFDIGAIETDSGVVNSQTVTIPETVFVTENEVAVFTVTLNQDPVETITVTLQTADATALAGADYIAKTETLTFQPGGSLTQQFTVTTVNDDIAEDHKFFFVQISNAVGAVIINADATVQLADDDSAGRPLLDSVERYPGVQPQFTWQPVAGAVTYEVWLSRIFPGSIRILTQEASVSEASYTPSGDLNPAFYRIWVRSVAAGGQKSAWSFPMAFEVQPTVVSPTTPGFNRRPTFVWDEIPNTSGYELFIRAVDGDIIHDDLQETSFTPSEDLPQGPIRWWIRSSNAILNRGYSAPADFTFQTTVLTPSEIIDDTTPSITWREVENSARYVVYIRNEDTLQIIRDDNLQDISFTPPVPLAAGSYRVWVKAIAGTTTDSSDGLWSRPLNFTITAVTNSDTDAPSDETELLAFASFRNHVQLATIAQDGKRLAEVFHENGAGEHKTTEDVKTVSATSVPSVAVTGSNIATSKSGTDHEFIDEFMTSAAANAALPRW